MKKPSAQSIALYTIFVVVTASIFLGSLILMTTALLIAIYRWRQIRSGQWEAVHPQSFGHLLLISGGYPILFILSFTLGKLGPFLCFVTALIGIYRGKMRKGTTPVSDKHTQADKASVESR